LEKGSKTLILSFDVLTTLHSEGEIKVIYRFNLLTTNF